MTRSRRELLINMDIDWFIFKNNQITLFICFTFLHKVGWNYPKQDYFRVSAFLPQRLNTVALASQRKIAITEKHMASRYALVERSSF